METLPLEAKLPTEPPEALPSDYQETYLMGYLTLLNSIDTRDLNPEVEIAKWKSKGELDDLFFSLTTGKLAQDDIWALANPTTA